MDRDLPEAQYAARDDLPDVLRTAARAELDLHRTIPPGPVRTLRRAPARQARGPPLRTATADTASGRQTAGLDDPAWGRPRRLAVGRACGRWAGQGCVVGAEASENR